VGVRGDVLREENCLEAVQLFDLAPEEIQVNYILPAVLAFSLLSSDVWAQSIAPRTLPMDGSSPPTPALLMVPVLVDNLPGAMGSVWHTDLWITNVSSQPVVYAIAPCLLACCCAEFNTMAPQSTRRFGDNHPRGRYFAALESGSIQLEVRLRDLSRTGSSAGVETPVVRGDEFRTDELNLIAVPRDPKFRVLVRFYMIDKALPLNVDQVDALGNVLRTDQVQLDPPSSEFTYGLSPAYGQLSLDTGTQQAAEPVRIRIKAIYPGAYFWGFASVTNNDTSEVTLILPRR
jgi:hypothetical protein